MKSGVNGLPIESYTMSLDTPNVDYATVILARYFKKQIIYMKFLTTYYFQKKHRTTISTTEGKGSDPKHIIWKNV